MEVQAVIQSRAGWNRGSFRFETSDENMNFPSGTYHQASINNPTSAMRRRAVENGPQYYLPMEMAAKVGPIDFNSEVGH